MHNNSRDRRIRVWDISIVKCQAEDNIPKHKCKIHIHTQRQKQIHRHTPLGEKHSNWTLKVTDYMTTKKGCGSCCQHPRRDHYGNKSQQDAVLDIPLETFLYTQSSTPNLSHSRQWFLNPDCFLTIQMPRAHQTPHRIRMGGVCGLSICGFKKAP